MESIRTLKVHQQGFFAGAECFLPTSLYYDILEREKAWNAAHAPLCTKYTQSPNCREYIQASLILLHMRLVPLADRENALAKPGRRRIRSFKKGCHPTRAANH